MGLWGSFATESGALGGHFGSHFGEAVHTCMPCQSSLQTLSKGNRVAAEGNEPVAKFNHIQPTIAQLRLADVSLQLSQGVSELYLSQARP